MSPVRAVRVRRPADPLSTRIGLVISVVLSFLCTADRLHAAHTSQTADTPGAEGSVRAGLTFEQRVAARRAIEQVYWRHRIWPPENPNAKPALGAVLTDAAIRARVEDALRKSSALETLWHRPIAQAQLQAELDRMAQPTQNARLLRELFAALGDDPRLIAETLARESLADRFIREWYATDARFHGQLKAKATAALAACRQVACMPSMGGDYVEQTWRRGGQLRQDAGIGLEADEWTALLDRLASTLGGSRDALPIHSLGAVEETPEAFVVTAVLVQERDVVRTATVSWNKVSFDDWWRTEGASLSDATDEDGDFAFSLPALELSACVPDTWTPTYLNIPPLKRYQATALWTGTEMIVWGGSVQGNLVPGWGTGGRYNPATDTWTPTRDAGAPSARYAHTAVWTGTQMIVWGGGPTLNDGGRYDPVSDTWTPTSLVSAPSSRSSHTAVWTGTQMIVWGGSGSSGNVNTGGRYDPVSDTWTPTSLVGAPSSRSSHAAVWTGT